MKKFVTSKNLKTGTTFEVGSHVTKIERISKPVMRVPTDSRNKYKHL